VTWRAGIGFGQENFSRTRDSAFERDKIGLEQGFFTVEVRLTSQGEAFSEVKKEAPATTFITRMKQGLRQEV
jgi:hypothetical protein